MCLFIYLPFHLLFYSNLGLSSFPLLIPFPSPHHRRTYRVPPKEHFRLFVRANAIRQRASAYTPWIVSEELVKRYGIPNKLASIFTNPKAPSIGRKRKADPATTEGAVKKMKAAERTDVSLKQPKVDPPPESLQPSPQRGRPGRKPGTKVKRDPNTPRKKPGPKPGSKRTPKVPKPEPGQLSPQKVKIKVEASDSDDDIALAVLASQASRQPKVEPGSTPGEKDGTTPSSPSKILPKKREIKMSQKMRQATLFDMHTPTKLQTLPKALTPRKSPHGRVSVCRLNRLL